MLAGFLALGLGGCGGCFWTGEQEALEAEAEQRRWVVAETEKVREAWVAGEVARRADELRVSRERADAERKSAEAEEARRREKALRAAREACRAVEAQREEVARHEDELRTFALKESPRIWETIQHLRATVAEQDERIAEMQRTARESGLPYRGREEYERIYRARNKLVRALRQVEDRLTEALMAAKRYEASPQRAEMEAATRRALENGVLESEWVWKQYEEMADEM